MGKLILILAFAGLQTHPVVTVRLTGGSLVPAGGLREAKAVVDGMMGRAGIAVRWVDCPCAREDGAALSLQIMGRKAEGRSPDAAGFAVIYPADGRMDGYAVVSYPVVERNAVEVGIGPALGATMAHEIGHLLLGRKFHSRTGVMAVRLGRREFEAAARGGLGFTEEEGERMRAGLRGR